MKSKMIKQIYLSEEALKKLKEQCKTDDSKYPPTATLMGIPIYVHPMLPFTGEDGKEVHELVIPEETISEEETDERTKRIKDWMQNYGGSFDKGAPFS